MQFIVYARDRIAGYELADPGSIPGESMYVHYPALELFYTTSIMTVKVNRAIL